MVMIGDVVQMNVGQILQTPSLPAADFRGRTIVISGANTGLGFQAAKHMFVLTPPFVQDQTNAKIQSFNRRLTVDPSLSRRSKRRNGAEGSS